jgi:bacillithiol biosynthesis cysteine-adding enzyme BshC
VLHHSGLSPSATRSGERDGNQITPGRLAIDIRRFPWIKRLPADYAHEYDRLADFYAGNPADEGAWTDAITRTQRFVRPREAVAALLEAQQRQRGAPAEALAAAALLRDPRTVAIVTGQQAVVFGGPLFTLLKALTAIQLAERIRADHQVPVVPIFWIDAEDHDWDEVKRCRVLDRELACRTVALNDPPGANEGHVAAVRLDDSLANTFADLEAALPGTEFSRSVLDRLKQAYTPGAGVADAFGRWLEGLLGGRGLVVFDSSDAAAKPLVADLFSREVERAGETSRLASQAGAALVERGYHAQATPQPGSLALFHLNHGREAIRAQGERFAVGDRIESKTWLLDRVRRSPADFSPNVLLRPLVQDTIFPTICYVAGPSELAYLGQLRRIYESFGIPMPLIHQRATATILDANAMRFLVRHEFPFESLRAQDEAALNELLDAQLPPTVEATLQDAERAIEERMNALARELPHVDATLEGAARSTLGRMQDDLRKLHGKIIQASKRRHDTLRRQYHHAKAQAFPDGHSQERQLAVVYFLNMYGPALVERLNEELTTEMGTHWVVRI